MGQRKGKKVKQLGQYRDEDDVFWMDLNEAKRAIAEKYESLADRYERQFPPSKAPKVA